MLDSRGGSIRGCHALRNGACHVNVCRYRFARQVRPSGGIAQSLHGVKDWHAYINDPALADAILYRLIHRRAEVAGWKVMRACALSRASIPACDYREAGGGVQFIWRRCPECLAGVPGLFGEYWPTDWRLAPSGAPCQRGRVRSLPAETFRRNDLPRLT